MKENIYRFAFLLLMVAALLLAGTNVLRSDDKPPPPIKLDVYPRMVIAGMTTADIRVNWRIARHPDNRSWSFVMQSDAGDFQLSQGQVDGEDGPVTFPICIEKNIRPCYRHVRAGNYVLEACVYRTEQKRYCDGIMLQVR